MRLDALILDNHYDLRLTQWVTSKIKKYFTKKHYNYCLMEAVDSATNDDKDVAVAFNEKNHLP